MKLVDNLSWLYVVTRKVSTSSHTYNLRLRAVVNLSTFEKKANVIPFCVATHTRVLDFWSHLSLFTDVN